MLISAPENASNFQVSFSGTGLTNLLMSTDNIVWQPATSSPVSSTGVIYLDTRNCDINSSLTIRSSELKETLWGKKVTSKNISFQNSSKLDKVPTFLWEKCTSMQNIFFGCRNFNQDISGWNVAKVTNRTSFDAGATLWQANYKPKFV